MQSLIGEFFGSIVSLPFEFLGAIHGPIQAILLLAGAIMVGAASAALGYLATGAAVELITPDQSARGPSQAGR